MQAKAKSKTTRSKRFVYRNRSVKPVTLMSADDIAALQAAQAEVRPIAEMVDARQIHVKLHPADFAELCERAKCAGALSLQRYIIDALELRHTPRFQRPGVPA